MSKVVTRQWDSSLVSKPLPERMSYHKMDTVLRATAQLSVQLIWTAL